MSKHYILALQAGETWRRAVLAALFTGSLLSAGICPAQTSPLRVAIDAHGVYSIREPAAKDPTIVSAVAAEIDGRWVRTTDYPRCDVVRSQTQGYLGQAAQWQVTC